MTDTTKLVKPADKITVMVDEKTRSILMSAGLVRRLAALVGSIEGIEAIFQDPTTQTLLMLEALRERNEEGIPVDKVNQHTLDDKYPMSADDGALMVKWIGEHVAYFFIDGALTLKDTMMTPIRVLQTLESSLAGLVNSPTSKASAGATDAGPAT